MKTYDRWTELARGLASRVVFAGGRPLVVSKYCILEDETEMRRRLIGRIGKAIRAARQPRFVGLQTGGSGE